MRPDDGPFAKQAIVQARLSRQEHNRVPPIFVGAVAVTDGKIIAGAHRSEIELGEHAEYTLLERKLRHVDLNGSTIFVTLEPCTLRSADKTPCAQRLIERRVTRVVIGMLDPNADIRGLGYQALRGAGIAVEFFDEPLVTEIEDLNREFVRFQRAGIAPPRPSAEFLELSQERRLDDWYSSLNAVYFHRNFGRTAIDICLHLIEVIGGLSLLASGKSKPGVDKERQVSKAIAWWLALCGKVGIRSVEDLLWGKFPAACPYCQQPKHDQELCAEKKLESAGPPWTLLTDIGKRRAPPDRLGAWQRMFNDIYPVTQTDEYGPIFARLYEELAELAEAVRVFPLVPGYFLSEAADVFAWLMRVQNVIDEKAGRRREQRGTELEKDFAKAYPDSCVDCGRLVCACPPILASTVGRIAHEVPPNRSSYSEGGSFLTPEKAAERFGPARRPAAVK